VTEAMDPKKELFSEKRLKTEVERLRDHSSQDIVTSILERITNFSKGVHHRDDITLMNIKMSAG
jgi:serine phosphatase RsbU (regulator of sigma subunit)